MLLLQGVPVRVLPALLLFLATFAHYFARVNVNIAIISMTEKSNSSSSNNDSSLCSGTKEEQVVDPATGRSIFCWSEEQKSLVKGAFYYGYAVLQVRERTVSCIIQFCYELMLWLL